MAGPNSWYQGASKIYTGVHAAQTEPIPLGINVVCRRILLIAAEGAAAVIVHQGNPAAGGFPIPCISADGSHSYLEMWVNSPNVLWISGSGNVYWIAEEV